ncbi:AGAP013211-PA-like protein [Anopheles sinensis]|uniref:AGAP013211-PA-like protein n=1 Tax=Anopheles sinensis TaxID=74873 RepID=A0A084VCW5_ANOSI|nr:AGAP013211-PA-like protein [Anopheles sinensis]
MVVNSVGAFAPRAVDRSQSFLQNRWNPYASGPGDPLGPGLGFDGPGGPAYHHHPPVHHHHQHHPHHTLVHHPLMAAGDGSQGYGVTAEGYGASSHGSSGGGGYDYHPPPPPHPPPPSIIHHPLPPLWPGPSDGGKSKGKGAALSALTLLAFLYFLNLLQSCLKEHMDTMNPTVMVMTAGANRRKFFIDRIDSSVDAGTAGNGSEEDDASNAEDAAAAYEKLSDRYQLLTTSNRTRNPFKRPPYRGRNKSPASGRKTTSNRYEKSSGSDDRFERSSDERSK